MADQDFDPTFGSDRLSLELEDRAKVESLRSIGLLVADGRRSRSHYFDGRFLAARDLTRDQNYFLTRQADLSRAGGIGVIAGLQVTLVDGAALQISAGRGVTMAGELVALTEPVVLALEAIPELDRLEATSGIQATIAVPAQDRSGLYVLALRPVEYTTRQIVKYPTTVDGKRSTEAGDIVEGVAVTLVPWRDNNADLDPWRQRARAARTVFVERSTRGVPRETLPLAMLLLDRGSVCWLDPWLVRREIGAEHAAAVGFDEVPRALREAHLIQYDQSLHEIMAQNQATGALRFAASTYFDVLPPAGRLPAAAISTDFTQLYFPEQTTVELSIVSDDELAVLIEDSLLMPPIDISGRAEDLDFTRIQVLIPMTADARRRLAPSDLRREQPLLAGPPSKRSPEQVLAQLSGQQTGTELDVADAPSEAAWRAALASVEGQLLWYVRARTLEQSARGLFPERHRLVIVDPLPEPEPEPDPVG